MAELIAVTGATGAVGSRVARGLAELGVTQRLIVRDAARAPQHAGAEVRAVAGGYADGPGMQAALTGADVLFLIPAAEAADRIAQHTTTVDAAVAAGVRRIVYLSFVDARPDSTFTLGRDHWATEEHIRACGVPFTFPRMNLYMDFIPSMVSAEGVIRGPAADGRLAAILRDDVAAAAVALLTTSGHDGRAYALTGREAFSLAEAAALMSERSGKPIAFEDETEQQAYASRATYGAPDWEVRGWVTSYQAIADGSLEAISGDVRELTGREPVTLAEYLRARPESLDHVVA